MKKSIDKVNEHLIDVISEVKNGKMSNQKAQTIINASSTIFKGISIKVNIERFVNNK